MPDLSLAVAVTRTELALADLAIQNPASGYEVVNIGPGAKSWRRETVKNQYVHGDTLVSAVMDVMQAPITVRVSGTTASQANSRLDTLLDAFAQFYYYVGLVIDGESWIWLCQPADVTVGESGALNKYHQMANIYEATFSIPRQPVPTYGTI